MVIMLHTKKACLYKVLFSLFIIVFFLLYYLSPAQAEQDGTGNEIIPLGSAAGNKLDVGTGKLTTDGVTGNVGIGSTVPQAKLDVEGSAYFGNGNIGVGSSAPAQKLDVVGTVKATSFSGDGSSLTGLSTAIGWTKTGTNVYVTTSTDNVGIGTSVPLTKLDIVGAGTTSATKSLVIRDSTKTATVTVLDNGYVGIGTSVPGAPLEVNQSPAFITSLRLNNSYAGLDRRSQVEFYKGGTAYWSLGQDAGMSGYQQFFIKDEVSGQPKFMIDGTGNIGIGGNIGFDGSGNLTSGNLFVTNGGNVGINSIAPRAKLDVEGSVYVGNGNVGLGTSVPVQKLDVLGNIYVNGNIGIGSVSPRSKLEINNTVSYTAEIDNGNSGAAKTIDWRNGNKQKVTIDNSCTFTFTAPGGPANLLLKVVHNATATVFTETWPTTPGDVKWPSNITPALTDSSGAIDVVSCYYDGTDYLCQAGLTFQ
jgi:hypothetical protein